MTVKPVTIDEYIETFPLKTQVILQKIRKAVHDAAPDATEAISYAMPTFKLNGNLVHFAAWKKHIGFYPAPPPTATFEKDLASYEVSKGTIKFPLDQPVPLVLIRKIVKYRVKETLGK